MLAGDLGDSLPDILQNLRPYDRNQLMQGLSNGGLVKPKEICWGYEWDVRGLFSGDGDQPAQQRLTEAVGEKSGG